MARDRLPPSAFGKIHSRFLTPHWGTAIVAAVAAAGAATLPIDLTMRAIHGDWIPAGVLAGYIGLGASIYMFFGRRRSLVRLSVAH